MTKKATRADVDQAKNGQTTKDEPGWSLTFRISPGEMKRIDEFQKILKTRRINGKRIADITRDYIFSNGSGIGQNLWVVFAIEYTDKTSEELCFEFTDYDEW